MTRPAVDDTQLSNTKPRGWRRFAIGVASVAMLTTGLAVGTAAVADATPVLGFSYVNSTFKIAPVANLSDQNTWVEADGVSAYTGTLTARDASNAVMPNLDVADIVFSATGKQITISAVVNHHDGTYTATYTSTVAQPDSTAAVAYRGVKVFQQSLVCTTAAKITEFIPTHNGVSYSNTALPTKVTNGVAQVVTYNPAVWPSMGWGTYNPNSPVTIKGTGTPGSTVSVSGQTANSKCTAKVAANGTWSCTVPISAFPLPKLQWTTQNLKTGLLYQGDGYSAWQTFTVTSPECGNGASVLVGSGYTTPLAIDFSGTGKVQTLTADQAPAKFAMGPNNEMLSSGWLAPSAGFVVRDTNRNGKVDNIDELFGGNVGDAFNALRAYDNNGDGVIDSKDFGYTQLSVWRDANSNKVTDSGELVSLQAAGVVSISVAHTDTWEYDAAGNAVYEHGSVTLTGGTKAVMNDVYFAMRVGTALPIPFRTPAVLSTVTSTFASTPAADPYDRRTWLKSGVDSYTLVITAKDDKGTLLPNLKASDFAITASNASIQITAITNTGNGTYTAKASSSAVVFTGTVTATYKGAQIGQPLPALFT